MNLGSPNFGEENLYGSEKNGSLVCHIQSSRTISPDLTHGGKRKEKTNPKLNPKRNRRTTTECGKKEQKVQN